MPSEKRKIGDIGEMVAARYLRQKGFIVIDQNYLRKWGEIDVVAKKGTHLHFVEVKTLQARVGGKNEKGTVSRENNYNPVESVHPKKLRRVQRAAETYLSEKNVPRETPWQIDVVSVLLDLNSKKAKVEMLDNVI